MNIGASADAVLPLARAMAESLMNAECTISAPAADVADDSFDETTGVSTPAAATTVYSGPCRVRVPQLAEREQASGQFQWSLQDSVLSVPIAALGIEVGAVVTITASLRDPDLVARTFEVKAVLRGSQVSARRLVIREA